MNSDLAQAIKEVVREVIMEDRASNLKLAQQDYLDDRALAVLDTFKEPKSLTDGFVICRSNTKIGRDTFCKTVQRLCDLGKLKAVYTLTNRRRPLYVKV